MLEQHGKTHLYTEREKLEGIHQMLDKGASELEDFECFDFSFSYLSEFM